MDAQSTGMAPTAGEASEHEGAPPPGSRRPPRVGRGRLPRRARPWRWKYVIIYGALGIYAIATIGAFLWVLIQALKTNQEFFATSPWTPPEDWQWGNFGQVWEQAHFGSFFVNTLLISGGSAAGSVLLATPAAYALSRISGVKSARALRQIFLVGIMMPPILTVIPLYYLWLDLGLLDSLFGLGLIYTGLMLPFSVYFLAGYFTSVPFELEEAAAIDGAGMFATIRRVFVPVVSPALLVVFMVNILWAWNEFFYALIFLQGQDRFTMAIGVYQLQVNGTYSAQWVPVFAGMLIAVGPILLLYVLVSERVTEGMTAGAVKG
jgi:raffinose/stachyose/melibiose transport system permease protein/N-acetylglucosamine transport system permease protein